MMSVEVLGGPQCRAGLTPAVSLCVPPSAVVAAVVSAQAQAASLTSARLPPAAMAGSHAWPVVTTA